MKQHIEAGSQHEWINRLDRGARKFLQQTQTELYTGRLEAGYSIFQTITGEDKPLLADVPDAELVQAQQRVGDKAVEALTGQGEFMWFRGAVYPKPGWESLASITKDNLVLDMRAVTILKKPAHAKK